MVSPLDLGLDTSRIFKMAAAMLQVNGCVEIENLMELCAIPKQKIQLNGCISDSSHKPSLTFNDGITVEGMRTVALYIASICQNVQEYGPLLGKSPLERAEIDQWLEYRQIDVESALHDRSLIKSMLQDFNSRLANKIYLVSNKPSLADVILYYALHSVIRDMMPQEKEIYTNVSRWFNQVQSILAARQGLSLITFQRNQLYS